MTIAKHIALVAHDKKKPALLAWINQHQQELSSHHLYATGSTGRLIADNSGLSVNCLESGPLGGDLQLGALISEGKIDILIFFWDPLEAQPHDPDIRALLRIAVVWNIPFACNGSSADFIFSSRHMFDNYQRVIPDYQEYLQRNLNRIEAK